MSREFLGLITEDYNSFDKFQKMKIEYLNEVYDNEKTQEVYWGVFQRFVHFLELNKNKDLYMFNAEEIEELLQSLPTTSIRTKRAAWTAIYKYLDWSINRGYNYTGVNPCKDIKIEDILKINKNALAKKIYSLEEVYKIAEIAYINGSLAQEILALLLPRYGILGRESSWLINLKCEDIDYVNRVIHIYDEEDNTIERIIEIDDNLINWLEKAKDETGYTVKGKQNSVRPITFYDYGYVFKTTRRDNEKINKMVLYGYMQRICENAGVNKISFSDLVRSKKIDMLNKIKEEKGELKIEDFKYVSNFFSPNSSYTTYSTLLNDYKILTGEK